MFTGNEVPQNSASPKVVNGVRGGSATLLLELPAGKNASVIIWQHRGRESHDTPILIVQLNKSASPQIWKTDPERGKRLNIARSSSLQISNLTAADEGSYTAQITTDSRPYLLKYVLRVFGKSKYKINTYKLITYKLKTNPNHMCQPCVPTKVYCSLEIKKVASGVTTRSRSKAVR